MKKALDEIPDYKMPKIRIKKPAKINYNSKKRKLEHANYNESTATRKAYGEALYNLAKSDSNIIAVDAEVSNSTYSETVKKISNNQFIESFIAEQNMVGMGLGLSKKGFNVFASSFAAFLTRAHDQIRMSGLSNSNITFVGSHSGVSIGEDGASQMGLDDISMFRGILGSFVFYPSDAFMTEKLTYLCSKLKGIKYIRTTRANTSLIYNKDEKFAIGDFKVLKESKKDKCVFVGSGITVYEALKAYEKLNKKGINVAVVDLYSIKPFNHEKFVKFVKNHGKKIIVSEDHFREGGIGEMLFSKISGKDIKFKHLCVKELPHSGKPEELLKKYGIDSDSYVRSFKGKW